MVILDGQSKPLTGLVSCHRKDLIVFLINQRHARDFCEAFCGTIIRKFNEDVLRTTPLSIHIARVKLQAIKHTFLSKFHNQHVVKSLPLRTTPAHSRVFVHYT